MFPRNFTALIARMADRPFMRAVLFDFGGTLDSDGLTWGDRFYPLYREVGIDAPRERWNKAFYRSDDRLHSRFKLDGLSLEETLRLQVGCVLEDLAPERRDAGTAIAGRFLDDCRKHFSRNRPVLERLKTRYRLGIVSNFYGNLSGILESEGLAELFEVVADSGVVGHLKPSPEIFLFAAGRLAADPRECLMVGDSVARDMRGAEGLAMAHALLNPSAPDACCAAALRLRELPELEGLLS